VRVFQTVIPHGLHAQHATELHAPVIRLFPKSRVAQAYRELAAEVRQLVEDRNARRAARGEPPLDVESEVAKRLRNG